MVPSSIIRAFEVGWKIHEPLERQLEPLGQAALKALRLWPGERGLDIGCGIGATPGALTAVVGARGGGAKPP